jgi:hypothetical protein
MESRFSSMSSESWKDWVTEQRQEYSQRVKSAHLTREKGSSSWGWPTASVAGCVEGGVAKNVEMTPSGFKATRENGTSYGAKLRDAVIHHEKNWPTPTTAEGTKIGNQPNFGQVGLSNHPSIVGQPDRAKLNKSGKSQGSQQWPTPRVFMHKDSTKDRGKSNLGEKVRGKLNPDWVEQLMGLPVGWTDLGFWATE